jgi:hypothetical protein
MRFKTIFLIFSLAMFMLAVVAWAEDDDDQGDNDDQLYNYSTYIIAFEAPSTYFPTIASVFNTGDCSEVNNDVHVDSYYLFEEGDEDEDDEAATPLDGDALQKLSTFYEAMIPAVVLVCAVFTNDLENYIEDQLIPNLQQAVGPDYAVTGTILGMVPIEAKSPGQVKKLARMGLDIAGTITYQPQ